jgi:hypothetical protein
MKKLAIFLSFLFSFFLSCSTNLDRKDISSYLTLKLESPKLIEKIIFPDNEKSLNEFLIEFGDALYKNHYSKDIFDKYVKEYQVKYNQKIEISYDEFMIGMKTFSNNIQNGRINNELVKVFSNEAIKAVERIRDELEKSQNEEEFYKNVAFCKEFLSKNTLISENEQKYLIYQLELVVRLTSENEKKERQKDINGGYTCNWWKSACVFYTSVTQLPLLLAIYYANQNTPLEVYVASYGINYIAACCGFCGCNCPDGCPAIY